MIGIQKRRTPAGGRALGNAHGGRSRRIAARIGLQSFTEPRAAVAAASPGSVLFAMDASGALTGTAFIVHTADGKGQVVPIEALVAYAPYVNPDQAQELLNIVATYRAQRAGLRGHA
jgi:hypothetical protein